MQDTLQPHKSVYSLSPFSPASDVTVIVKLVGSSERTEDTWISSLGRTNEISYN